MNCLNGYFGDLHWWPADDPFEVMVGAILTQNTAWTNVEMAIQGVAGEAASHSRGAFSNTGG